jgi:pimeloyl-ACP methyl ester carboxylesterase
MDRRTFVSIAAAGAASSLLPSVADAQPVPKPAPKAQNIVFVHGLFADGSCWSEVIARLQPKGFHVTSVQNPLTTLPEAVAAAQRELAVQDGPTVLVGHSFSGMIVTEAGVDPKVSAVVYVAARAPDSGEDYTALASRFPTPPASAGIVWSGDWGQLSEEAFLRDFAGDVPADKARVLYAVQAVVACRQDDARGMAIKAKLVRRFHARPDDQSGPRTLHGKAHGRKDDRGGGKPSFSDIASGHDRKPDPGGGGTDVRPLARTRATASGSWSAASCSP